MRLVARLALVIGALALGAATAAAQDPAPVRVGGNVQAPLKIKDVAPIMPEEAIRARVGGVVIIEATIGTDGTVSNVQVLRHVPLLDQAAVDAVRQWVYRPTMLNGVAVPVIMTVTVTFTLAPERAAPPAAPATFPQPSAMTAAVPGIMPTPPQPLRVTTVPRRLRGVTPIVSDALMSTGYDRLLRMEVTVGANGNVTSVTVLSRSGQLYDVDDSFLNAVKGWTFEPTLLNGRAVPVVFWVSMWTTKDGVKESMGPVLDPRPADGAMVGSASPLRVGGSITAPANIRHVDPVYPAIAQAARVQGVVIVEVTIDPQGKVSDAKVLRSVPLLDEAALNAVRQWEYEPTMLNGVAVPIIMTVTVKFSIGL